MIPSWSYTTISRGMTPEWNENWLALTRLLKLGEGFQLIFVFTDEHQAVDFLHEQLLKQFTFAMTATPVSETLYHNVVQGLSTLIESSSYSPPFEKWGKGGDFPFTKEQK
jgi:uncharacterized membrane protein